MRRFGAVGLIDIYSIASSVNLGKVNGKLPLVAGYALHGNQQSALSY